MYVVLNKNPARNDILLVSINFETIYILKNFQESESTIAFKNEFYDFLFWKTIV